MRIADSYFVQLENGTRAWLAVGKGVPDGATVIEIRPMIVPDDGMILRNKETGEESSGHWMRGEDSADKWEEIEEPKEDVNG
jgi:hypothetical protein